MSATLVSAKPFVLTTSTAARRISSRRTSTGRLATSARYRLVHRDGARSGCHGRAETLWREPDVARGGVHVGGRVSVGAARAVRGNVDVSRPGGGPLLRYDVPARLHGGRRSGPRDPRR